MNHADAVYPKSARPPGKFHPDDRMSKATRRPTTDRTTLTPQLTIIHLTCDRRDLSAYYQHAKIGQITADQAPLTLLNEQY